MRFLKWLFTPKPPNVLMYLPVPLDRPGDQVARARLLFGLIADIPKGTHCADVYQRIREILVAARNAGLLESEEKTHMKDANG